MSIVKLENIEYSVKNGHSNKEIMILRNINLKVNKGEFRLITGPSGSGKTTLLQIIGIILHPTKGERTIFDKKLSLNNNQKRILDIRSRIGYLFQNSYLPPNLTIKEYLEIQLSLSKIGISSAKEKIIKISERLNIEQLLNTFPLNLSGGEKQRVYLAALLAKDIELLLLDEPTGSLDFENKIIIWDILKQLKKEKLTIVVVSHDESIIPYVDFHHKLEDGNLIE